MLLHPQTDLKSLQQWLSTARSTSKTAGFAMKLCLPVASRNVARQTSSFHVASPWFRKAKSFAARISHVIFGFHRRFGALTTGSSLVGCRWFESFKMMLVQKRPVLASKRMKGSYLLNYTLCKLLVGQWQKLWMLVESVIAIGEMKYNISRWVKWTRTSRLCVNSLVLGSLAY